MKHALLRATSFGTGLIAALSLEPCELNHFEPIPEGSMPSPGVVLTRSSQVVLMGKKPLGTEMTHLETDPLPKSDERSPA